MAKQIKLKTSKNNASITAYLKKVPKKYQADAETLLELFSSVTKAEPKMWGTSIVGFGEYIYHRSNGDESVFMATGFSIRTNGPTLYIMPGYGNFEDLMDKLGPHKLGKSCLYLKSLEGIHLPTFKQLIKRGLSDLKKSHTVTM